MRPSELTATLGLLYKTRRPGFIRGKPGIGKSAIIRQFADNNNLGFVDFRLLYCDPVDLRGLPRITGKTTEWMIPSVFPKDGNGILFFDEMTAAAPAVQAACYQITHDRRIGEYVLPDGWSVIAAGNSQSDRSVANRMPSALVSRFINVELEVSNEDWGVYALDKGIESEILAFIRFRPSHLFNFDPKTWQQDKPFACPRTWEYLDQMIKADSSMCSTELIQGTVGETAGTEFVSFMSLYKELPDLDAILMNPDTAGVPEKPALRYAVSAGIARKITDSNIERALKYLARIPKEFEVYSLKDALKINPQLSKTKAMNQWFTKNSAVLM